MMSDTTYMKDTKGFWQGRNEARAKLDAARSQASRAEKNAVKRKLRADVAFLKTGKIVAPKG